MPAPFTVRSDCFEGPVELLLTLVRQRELDVLDLALAEIVRRYAEYVELAERPDLDEVGDFLVLLTHLMEIKSKRLLPRAEAALPEEPAETSAELVRQLLEYKRFKEAAVRLWRHAEDQQRRLARSAEDVPVPGKAPATQPIDELEMWDLVSAFSRLMKENVVPVEESIAKDPTPISEYIAAFLERLRRERRVSFRDLIGLENTRAQIIGKFLALLEVVRQKDVWAEVQGYEITLLSRPGAGVDDHTGDDGEGE